VPHAIPQRGREASTSKGEVMSDVNLDHQDMLLDAGAFDEDQRKEFEQFLEEVEDVDELQQ
jgi:hypothetical protein